MANDVPLGDVFSLGRGNATGYSNLNFWEGEPLALTNPAPSRF